MRPEATAPVLRAEARAGPPIKVIQRDPRDVVTRAPGVIFNYHPEVLTLCGLSCKMQG